jgi:hypothetical protein
MFTAVVSVMALDNAQFMGSRSTEISPFKYAELTDWYKEINHFLAPGVSHSYILPSLKGMPNLQTFSRRTKPSCNLDGKIIHKAF